MAYPRFRLSRAHKTARFTGGDVNITTSAWAALDGSAMDLSLPARVGDTVEVALFGILHIPSGSASAALDVASVVSGSAVNYWASNGASTGYTPWYRDGLDGGNTAFAGSAYRVVASGDLASGVLTLRPMGRADSVTCAVWRSDSVPLFFAVKNLGPAA